MEHLTRPGMLRFYKFLGPWPFDNDGKLRSDLVLFSIALHVSLTLAFASNYSSSDLTNGRMLILFKVAAVCIGALVHIFITILNNSTFIVANSNL